MVTDPWGLYMSSLVGLESIFIFAVDIAFVPSAPIVFLNSTPKYYPVPGFSPLIQPFLVCPPSCLVFSVNIRIIYIYVVNTMEVKLRLCNCLVVIEY